MWKDVSKSSLWFGFGSLCFMSSCFTRGVHFSIFSFLSPVGLLFLGLSFFSNSMRKRDVTEEIKREFKLTDDDILRVGKLILPAANLAISKTRRVFSGEPAMTLKVDSFANVCSGLANVDDDVFEQQRASTTVMTTEIGLSTGLNGVGFWVFIDSKFTICYKRIIYLLM
ncbi:Reticulon-like protein B18 [Castilleja foliolosa]|uniref:Reticulon-like protein B18 n=1 Tax=Castilleja foliolosa TaxID=1961234 RepID=A0ABD3C3P8_9LAMI